MEEIAHNPIWEIILRSSKFIAPILSILIALLFTYVTARFFSTSREKISEQEIKIYSAIGEAESDRDFDEFFSAKLNLIAERARLLMIKAEARANLLYVVGTWLVIFSVFAPIASISIYINQEPLSLAFIESLGSLRDAEGNLPAGIEIAAYKDWRVLLSGISFGFLFLAAASALFAQSRRQMETFFRLASDVDYFEAIVSAVEIQNRADSETLTEEMQSLVNRVLSELLKRPILQEATEPKSASTAEQIKQATEILKGVGK